MGDAARAAGVTIMARSPITVLLLAAALTSAGCAGPPPPPPRPPPAPAPPPPPPPPPPKCESLQEKCIAIAETTLTIGPGPANFKPPEGWTYANDGEIAMAVAPTENALVAWSNAADSGRDVLTAIVEKILTKARIENVSIKALRGRLRKPQTKVDAGELKIELWEVDATRQAGQAPSLADKGSGTLLIAVAPLGERQSVVGSGFVVKPDAEPQVAAIMQSVQSLRGSP